MKKEKKRQNVVMRGEGLKSITKPQGHNERKKQTVRTSAGRAESWDPRVRKYRRRKGWEGSRGRRHKRHSNCPDQEVHDQRTTSVETNGHGCPSPWEGNSTQDRNSGKTSQHVKDHSRGHLYVWIQNPFGWWQDTGPWHDL